MKPSLRFIAALSLPGMIAPGASAFANSTFATFSGAFAVSTFATYAIGGNAARADGGSSYGDAELRAVEGGDEAKIRELRDEEVTQLRIALGRREPAHRRADLYFRLAEIYLEAYHSEFLLEGRVHEKRLEKGMNDKFIDRAHSKPYLNSGIAACQEIVNLGIPYAKMDRVIYFLAFNYGELGNRKESIKYHEMLVNQYPDSPFLPEAYKELGDDAYDSRDYARAVAFYNNALRKATSDSAPRIYHKLAWSLYRLKRYNEAIDSMKQAISTAGQSGEKFVNLREEALRDMAIFMTESGKVDEAIDYFKQVAPDKDYYPKALERLGHQYERNVEPAKAAIVYEALLKANPESEPAFRVRVKLVDLDLRQGHYDAAIGRIQGIVIPKSTDHETEVAGQNLRAMVRRTATEHHESFRRKGGRENLVVAESFYTVYLKSFLARPEAGGDPRGETPEIQMYLAEVKRDLGKSGEASALYRQVVESKDKRYAKEAGALWTASLSEAIKKQNQGLAKDKAGMEKDYGSPSPLEKEFVEAADSLQEALGETSEGREASLRAAQVLAGYKSTQKDAIERCRKIIQRWPSSPQALTAARLWLQIDADDLPPAGAAPATADQASALSTMHDAVQEIAANDALMAADKDTNGGKLKASLSDDTQSLRVSKIAKEEADKDYGSAGKGYEDFAAQSTSRDAVEKAYNNAVSSYVKAGDATSAERVSEAWFTRYPKSGKAAESARSLATRLLIQGEFDGAARAFERISVEMKDAEALDTAARVQAGNGNVQSAQALWQRYLTDYPEAPSRQAVALGLARLAESAGNDSEAGSDYKTCVGTGELPREAATPAPRKGRNRKKSHAKHTPSLSQGMPEGQNAELSVQCLVRLADLLLRDSDQDGARGMYKKVAEIDAASAPVGVSPFVGYARFRLADLMEKGATFDPLKLPEAQLQKAIKQRLDFLEPLARAYTSAVDAGGPWAVAASGRLAAFAYRFADDVDAISPPANADEEGLVQFRKGLSKFSAPLREQAIRSWKDAYAKAVSLELLSPAVPEIADRLADARSPLPARAQGARGQLRLAGLPTDGGKDGASTAMQKTREKLLKNAENADAWLDYGNLLWGSGKPQMAKIAYDRALGLNHKLPAALNNRGVITLALNAQWPMGGTLSVTGTDTRAPSQAASAPGGQVASAPIGITSEDWLAAPEAMKGFEDALKGDEFALAPKFNRAVLLGYYRLFGKAKPVWEQVVTKSASVQAMDGLASATQGLGDLDGAEAEFKKATDAGGSSKRFALVYHQAARFARQVEQDGASGASSCLERLDQLDASALSGFERDSAERLRRACTAWKQGNK